MFGRKKSKQAFAPPATRIYAIGDIHGSIECLKKLHELILKNDVEAGTISRKVIIYLGDYVDRGEHSKEVVEYLLKNQIPGFENIFLLGNHEFSMLKFIEDAENAKAWLVWGGDTTIKSYGVNLEEEMERRTQLRKIANMFAAKIPEAHLNFYKNLKLRHIEGDYIFVHAGLRPGLKLDEQDELDLLMIREDFIENEHDFGKTVVFGHTIFPDPLVRPGKIGIDTGAYGSGKLTAVMLENNIVKFIST